MPRKIWQPWSGLPSTLLPFLKRKVFRNLRKFGASAEMKPAAAEGQAMKEKSAF
jgi:hypothetical protein